MAISHVVLFLAAVGVSIPLLVKRRLAFWVPLVAGAIAAIVFWGVLISLIFSDQALVNGITAANRVSAVAARRAEPSGRAGGFPPRPR